MDSINFLPMPLEELPKALELQELAKGYFPLLYNRKENQHVVRSSLPDIAYYNPDGMKQKKLEAFMEWYKSHKNNRFDFKTELLKYRRSDVDILRQACLKFRKKFMDITSTDGKSGIDPFESCLTIASACNLVFRTKFLQDESIGIIPSHGYRPEQKQSMKAQYWMKYISECENIHIQHVGNGGEKKVVSFLVDGYYTTKAGEQIVMEFNGCFWHGCPKCYAGSTVNPVTDCLMSDLYQRTLDKKRYLEENGYKYASKWECEFDQE